MQICSTSPGNGQGILSQEPVPSCPPVPNPSGGSLLVLQTRDLPFWNQDIATDTVTRSVLHVSVQQWPGRVASRWLVYPFRTKV